MTSQEIVYDYLYHLADELVKLKDHHLKDLNLLLKRRISEIRVTRGQSE